MPSLKIAAAQSESVAGDIAANVATHCRFIAEAAAAGVDLMVFPELSLSGYELPLLRACAVHPDDEALSPIRALAASKAIAVVVGAPVGFDSGRVCIGAIVFLPDGRISIYCKQHLHPGEERFAVAGEGGCRVRAIKETNYALAICADATHDRHAETAAAAGASLYLAGVLVSEAGYAADSGNFQRHAARHGMLTLMANHGGPSGGYASAGKSAIWSPDGTMLVAAPGTGDYLVVAARSAGVWSGQLLAA